MTNSNQRTVLVTGGTGFIGKTLCNTLSNKGFTVTVLSRNGSTNGSGNSGIITDLADYPPDESCDAVINLAGENLSARRWNSAQKQRLIESRVQVTEKLVDWIASRSQPPAVLISGSAVGWYGHRDDTPLTESAEPGTGFGHELCARWEQAARQAEAHCRLCLLRTGIVLGEDGGPLGAMLPAFRWGAGGPMGSGRQWWSWIHRKDLVAIILFLLEHPELSGPINGTAPTPVTQGEFARALGRRLKRPAFLPMPGFMARLLLGEFADEILLHGQRVIPEKVLQAGFRFSASTLPDALKQLDL